MRGYDSGAPWAVSQTDQKLSRLTADARNLSPFNRETLRLLPQKQQIRSSGGGLA
jgi:hypothetical protein